MNESNPLDAVERWLRGSAGGLVLPIAMALEIPAADANEALEGLVAWIRQPRDGFRWRTHALTLRALIDFECLLASSEEHQWLLDQNLLYAVDAGSIPAKNRAAINEFLAHRTQNRPDNRKAAEAWLPARPLDQSIYEWWWSHSVPKSK